ncbi:hypothetical protein [Metapseudomonas otitidis]|uniref:hypothetical protein n=1 Tax=Metapseudomonas otitidis TaxID=319939 RepID=UPI0013F60A45|nr:hypothetical protein [Pseudomonas otitidis]
MASTVYTIVPTDNSIEAWAAADALNAALTTFGDNYNKTAAEAKIAECAAWLRDGLRVVASIAHSNYDPRDLYPR